MIIGIDISQTAHGNTGVSNYLVNLVLEFLKKDKENQYVLFFSSLRRRPSKVILEEIRQNPRVKLKVFKIPPTLLSIIWNNLHLLSVETLIGYVDVFISSDWAEPPVKKAKKATIIYDLIVYKYPEETHNMTELRTKKFTISPDIVSIQKRKLSWVKKESDVVFCISESTKKDAMEMLGIEENRLKVIYPGFNQ